MISRQKWVSRLNCMRVACNEHQEIRHSTKLHNLPWKQSILLMKKNIKYKKNRQGKIFVVKVSQCVSGNKQSLSQNFRKSAVNLCKIVKLCQWCFFQWSSKSSPSRMPTSTPFQKTGKCAESGVDPTKKYLNSLIEPSFPENGPATVKWGKSSPCKGGIYTWVSSPKTISNQPRKNLKNNNK